MEKEIDLYDGKYEPEPFRLSSNARTCSIIAAIVAALACVVILGNTVFSNAQENDIEGILNFAISIGVGVLAYFVAVQIAKASYKKRIEAEAAAFERKKQEAVPYTVCEFCGGRIKFEEKTFGVFAHGGFSLTNGTLQQHTNYYDDICDYYSCDECLYIVRCDATKTYLTGDKKISVKQYKSVNLNLLESSGSFKGSPITEEQLKSGRLVAYINSKIKK